MTKNEVDRLGDRVEKLGGKDKPVASKRSILLRGLLTLDEPDQICLAYLIRDLERENIEAAVNPANFEAWLSKRPPEQQTLARKVLAEQAEVR